MKTNVRSYAFMMPTRIPSSRGEKTRRAILDGSYRLIIRQGFAATSMREIARQSHVALGGIYNHFGSKEEIFRAIIEERHPFLQLLPVLQTMRGETAQDFVRNAARTLLQELGRRPDFVNLMLVEIVEFKARHIPPLFRKFLPMVAPLVKRLAPFQRQTRKIPPLVIVRAFVGMFFSLYMTEMLLGRVMPPLMRRNSVEHFVDIFLHGILEEESQ